ncbi:DUF1175 family protein [Weissella coleopterorum]|uniref:DUF1175 family protein n=1 Tax=Weissella coleopterorum TaxID=2714949 RepID=A0A6G8B1M0_9LACO|nr:NlpC/P60 family protein [Weissella coleopterorum]QIL51115.1 DUF1175 family protein [Weissella coleopterorum]
MSNLENVKLSNTGKMFVAAAAVTAGTFVQVNQNEHAVNADDTQSAVKNLGKTVNTYKIQAGDTLTKIAKANNVALDDLVKLNGITNKNMIIVGQSLQLSENENVAVDGTKISDLKYNANADTNSDHFMTVSEYNAWVNDGRQVAATSVTETVEATATSTKSDTNAVVDGTNVADLQYNANADTNSDGYMTVSEYNNWVNNGRPAVNTDTTTTEDNAATSNNDTTTTENNTTASNNDASATANVAADGTNAADLQYNANADTDGDGYMTVSEYNNWVNNGRPEANNDTTTTATEDNATASKNDNDATANANTAVDGTNVADLQYNANADTDGDGYMTVSEYNNWVNNGRPEANNDTTTATEDNATASNNDNDATANANTAVDGTNVADLQYNANADTDGDGYMTVSEYNNWVNNGRPEANTDTNTTDESATASKNDNDATANANTAVDGTNVADLQYNANADANGDGYMTVSEYNDWVNNGRPEANNNQATDNNAGETSNDTATDNNSQNQGSWYDVAMSLVGIPYVWGGHTPSSGLDCSGFTAWVYNHSGMTSNFPAYTVAQENATTSISVAAAQPGDLLFWGTPGATYHVGIYLGNNQFIAAPQPGDVVRVQTLTASWMPSFAGTLR